MLGLDRSRGSAVWISALIVLGVNTGISIYNVNELLDNDKQVDRSRKVLQQINQIHSDIKDAETGQRGFLITENITYLVPYFDALGQISGRLESLRNLIQGDVLQQEAEHKLSSIVQDKIGILQFTVQVHEHFGSEVARVFLQTGYGKEKMDAIRAQVGRMVDHENAQLADRAIVARSKYRATIFTTVVGGLLTLAMTSLAFALIRRELSRRRDAETGLLKTQGVLRARAEELAVAQQQTVNTLALLDMFLENAPIGLAFLDKDLRFVRINRHFTDAIGRPSESIIGQRLDEFVDHFPAAHANDLHHVLQTREALVDRLVVDPAANDQLGRVWQSSYYPIFSSTGMLLGVGVVSRDITSRLISERALRESQARFRSLAESMPQFVWVNRADGAAEYFNQRWFNYTALQYEDCVGWNWLSALHEDDRERTKQRWHESLALGEPFEMEYRFRGSDGGYRWFLGRAVPQRDEAGVTFNWFGTGTDIHDVKELQNRLRQSVERFRLLAESIHQMVWTSDSRGEIDYYNPRWIEFTGVRIGDAHEWNEVVHPDDRDAAIDNWFHAISRGTLYETELRILRQADRVYRWHLVIAAPMRGEDGEVLQWVVSFTDINDRKRHEEDLERLVRERTLALYDANAALVEEVEVRRQSEQKERDAAQELRRSNHELEQFAYVASHDLQEPLRKIQAFGDRLQHKFRDELSVQGMEYLDRITAAATRMRKLIHDLLVYARIATGAQPITEIDLGRIIREVISDLDERIAQTDARIEVSPLPCIHADPIQMYQLFQNLIGNALKFHKRGVPPVIRICGEVSTVPNERTQPEVLRLTIVDNGIGFDEKYRERIFQIFQRLHGRHEYDGTGIGLAICRKIVERHSGTIVACGSTGNGATFEITLPICPAPVSAIHFARG